MSRISQNDKEVLQDLGIALVRNGSHVTAAATALTAAALVVTYTTDNPTFTANGASVIADGDITTAAEALEITREVHRDVEAARVDIAALYNSLEAFRLYGIRSTSAVPVSLTVRAPSIVAVTYTTDPVSFTANNAVVVADGDATTANQIVEAARELSADWILQRNDLDAISARYNALLAGDVNGSRAYGQCPALTGAADPIAWTFTTDNPSITPNAAVTITDGDAAESPPTQRFEYVYELDNQHTKNTADLTAIRTTLNVLLRIAGINP